MHLQVAHGEIFDVKHCNINKSAISIFDEIICIVLNGINIFINVII